MKKLLHERLREYSVDYQKGAYRRFVDEYETLVEDGSTYTDWSHVLKTIADEIERYYIPRPRFEDGEPVIAGDEAEYEKTESAMVEWYTVDDDGMFHICVGIVADIEGHVNTDFVKRPSPKAIDHDGVEIKEDETVWCIDTGTKLKVVSIDIKDGTILCDNEFIYDPDVLTHKEPDSIERIRDDIANFTYEGMFGGFIDLKAKEWAGRLSALIEKAD